MTAYTLSSTSAYLHRSTAKRLEGIFGDYLPDAEAKDFYEMEIASTGMMRSFVAVPCDMYFMPRLSLGPLRTESRTA